MTVKRTGVILCTIGLFGSGLVPGKDYCTNLKESGQKAVARAVLRGFRLDECCGGSSLAACLQGGTQYPLAKRLADFVCFEAQTLSADSIRNDLKRRLESLTSCKKYNLPESYIQPAGDRKAPVMVAAYISMDCYHCRLAARDICRAVTDGPLKGKASFRLLLSSERLGDLSLLIANRFRVAWDFISLLAPLHQPLDMDILAAKAEEAGVPADDFKALLYDQTFREHLANNAGLADKMEVERTPTFYINGRKYTSTIKTRWVIDAVECEYESLPPDRR